jgi:pimeloyl-ACP methyl ester carboxylesterase
MMKKIINNITVSDSDNGKEPLIFVHAFPLTSEMWELQVKEFSGDFRVVTYDVRGLGESKQSNNQFMMENFADDLITIIEDLKTGAVNAVGLSMGGYIIQRALLKRKELFKSVVMADTRLDNDTNDGLISRAASIQNILSGKRNEFIDGFISKLVSKKGYSNIELVSKIKSIISGSSDEGIAGAVLALATRTDNSGAFKDFTLPVLALVGRDDVLTPIECAQYIKDSFTNSELAIIEDSGHLSNLENPVSFNSYLRNFLEKHI